MPLSNYIPSRRRVRLIEKVASDAYIDPGIAQAVSPSDSSAQIAALRGSGASGSELRVMGRKLDEYGGIPTTMAFGLAGGLVSFLAGRGARSQFDKGNGFRGGFLVALTAAAVGMTIGNVLRRIESRKLAPVFNQAASSMEAGLPASA